MTAFDGFRNAEKTQCRQCECTATGLESAYYKYLDYQSTCNLSTIDVGAVTIFIIYIIKSD